MDDFWRGIVSTVLSGAVLGLLAWAAKAAWDRNRRRIELLEQENETLKNEKEQEDRKVMEDFMKDMRETRHALIKLELRLEEYQKIIPVVERLNHDMQMLKAWKVTRFREDLLHPGGGGNDDDTDGGKSTQ